MTNEKERESTELIFWSWGHDIGKKTGAIQDLVYLIKHYLSKQPPDFDAINSRLDMITKISSRMARTPLPFILEQISVNSQIQVLIENLQLSNRYKNLKFRIELNGEPIVIANSIWLTRVFEELFTNAIDAMDDLKNKEIEIVSRVREDKVTIFVSNRGKGIESRQLLNIMKGLPSFKADGKGRGLYIVRLTIELYGGHIEVDTDTNGTTVAICLPILDIVEQE